jgi:membrane-anchored protein YejM (alkaline phosphatase superfamily)
MILNETPRRILVTKLVSWGHWFALINIIVAIIIASIFVYSSPFPSTLLGTLFLFSNWFSHIGFLTFFGFVIFILPLCYVIPNAKLVKTVSSSIAALGLALLAFDALLYNKYGLHLSFSSADLIRSEAQTVMGQFDWQQWGFLSLLFVVWFSFQLIIANALWQRIERFQKYKLALPVSGFFMVCFVTSHAVHVWADANLYQPIVQQDNMFPLSYPATAKTLMSKYGLLDIQNYQQRKELQFDGSIEDVNYPAEPVYCAISGESRLIILIQTTEQRSSVPSALGMKSFSKHYDLSSSPKTAMVSTLFGLPELYLPALTNEIPLMLDLPSKLGLPVALFSQSSDDLPFASKFLQEWSSFNQFADSPTPKLAIGFVTSEQLEILLTTKLLSENNVLVTQLASNSDHHEPMPLFANFDLKGGLSSNEDISATALNVLGCKADEGSYSTGQNLVQPRRNWLVSTQGSKVIVMHNNQRIEVQSNGNYKIFERESGAESAESLNTGLLSQAMKHLSKFNK